MAKPMTYAPPTPQTNQAQEEVDLLVEALHDSGLLRLLAGGARAYPQLLATLLKSIDADAIRSSIALAGALSDPDPEAAQQLADGIKRARTEAGKAASDSNPPGFFRLAKRAHDKDVRRGIAAALAALAAVGGSLPK